MGDQTSAMEGVAVNPDFWPGKRVVVTGHTGFKGSWPLFGSKNWAPKLPATLCGRLPAKICSSSPRSARAVASARAGNVIGGGDYSKDRIVPDLLSAMLGRKPLHVRNPDTVRPWQHVPEPLSGYLLLAEKLWNDSDGYSPEWNFGPAREDMRPVRWIVGRLMDYRGTPMQWDIDSGPKPHEAKLLMLDSTKARVRLGPKPRWNLDQARSAIMSWHVAYERGESMHEVVMRQIGSFES